MQVQACPACSKRLRLPTDRGKLRVRCPACGAQFEFVPGVGDAAGALAGTVVGGRLELRRRIGRGGFAEVYEAFDRASRERCAVKVISSDRAGAPGTIAAFRREAMLWLRLAAWHPNILPLFLVHEKRGALYLETWLIEADADGCRTVADHLRVHGESIPLARRLRWAAQICDAVHYAHAHGLAAHADLKPGNVLVESPDLIRVADFGLAVAAGGAGQTARRGGGTPGYMAPEVYDGALPDRRSDVYSFGVSLWQLLAGTDALPFRQAYDESGVNLARALRNQQAEGFSAAPVGALTPVVARCLAPDPKARYGDFAELRAAMLQLAGPLLAAVFEQVDPRSQQDHPLHWWRIASCQIALDQFDYALAASEAGLALDPRHYALRLIRGEALCQLGRFDEATVALRDCLEERPDDYVALGALALALQGVGDAATSLAICERMLPLDPQPVEAWLHTGGALCELNRRDQARAQFERCLAFDDRWTAAWFGMLRCTDDLQEHLRILQRITAVEPSSAVAWRMLANLLLHLDRIDEAIAASERSIDLAPDDADSYYAAGIGLFARGRCDRALTLAETVLRLDAECEWAGKLRDGCQRSLGAQASMPGMSAPAPVGRKWWQVWS